MPNWSLVFLMAALGLGVVAFAAWIAGMNYVLFTAYASLCALVSCGFSVYEYFRQG